MKLTERIRALISINQCLSEGMVVALDNKGVDQIVVYNQIAQIDAANGLNQSIRKMHFGPLSIDLLTWNIKKHL